MDELRKCQYPISKRSLKSFASTSAPSKKPGRKTKVHNQSLIDLVKQQLQQYVKESERVVVIGRGTSRKMALAQHLTKKRYRIYMEEPSLHRAMSWTVFHRILKLHFPYVKNPRRRTDVCSHCKHLETGLLPKALRAMDKNRKQLTAIWPDYFRAFDASTVVQGKKKDPDKFPFLARFVSYVNRQNFDAMNNSERQQALTGSEKLSLHMAEAATVHEMKAHVELVEAYRWHQISARRQDAALTSRVSGTGLGMNEALLQVDFKENVRYPLSTHTELYILIISEVLDHDAQMGNMMINEALSRLYGSFVIVALTFVPLRMQPTFSTLWKLGLEFGATLFFMVSVIDPCIEFLAKVGLLSIRINVLYLVEQHGKGACDRLFGWTRAWLTRFIQKSPVYKIADLLKCYEDGSRDMMREDPNGPAFLSSIFDP
ncbi:unnamed protein product, partial [Symbiodinium necroappetens]